MEQITKYFNAEKAESVIFMIAGVAAIGFSIYFLVFVKKPFFIGLAYSLLAIALIQIIVGYTVYKRSPKDISRVTHIVQLDNTKIQSEEIPRMKTVMKNFVLYRYIEITLLALGIILFFLFKNEFTKGLGLGIIIQSGLMLAFDYFAEDRGKTYLAYLFDLIK